MNEVVISTVLCNILIVCFCIMTLAVAAGAIQSFIYDWKREKRDQERDARDFEYHEKRMKSLE